MVRVTPAPAGPGPHCLTEAARPSVLAKLWLTRTDAAAASDRGCRCHCRVGTADPSGPVAARALRPAVGRAELEDVIIRPPARSRNGPAGGELEGNRDSHRPAGRGPPAAPPVSSGTLRYMISSLIS